MNYTDTATLKTVLEFYTNYTVEINLNSLRLLKVYFKCVHWVAKLLFELTIVLTDPNKLVG